MVQSKIESYPPTVVVEPKIVPMPEVVAGVNHNPELTRSNIRKNIELDVEQISPYETQWDSVVALVAGGASLEENFELLIDKYKSGMPVITVNGSYKYCMDRGIRPAGMVMLDPREFNNRFVDPIHEDCKYFIASQCDPSVFEKLDGKNLYMWHCNTAEEETVSILNEKYGEAHKDYFPILGGSTVILRSIHLLRLLGFPKFEIFGFDSCIIGNHHAYEQPENDDEEVITLVVGKRSFQCTVAQYHQAKEFIEMVSLTGEHYEMVVHGDGLISYLINNPEILNGEVN